MGITQGISIVKKNKQSSGYLEISSYQNGTFLLGHFETFIMGNPVPGMFVFDAVRNEFMIYNPVKWEEAKQNI
jgi:hypothetical protein